MNQTCSMLGGTKKCTQNYLANLIQNLGVMGNTKTDLMKGVLQM